VQKPRLDIRWICQTAIGVQNPSAALWRAPVLSVIAPPGGPLLAAWNGKRCISWRP
jgi:hypothetical protein